ncbi:pseudoazurin [Roseibium denhamense]|uniref:Pseudoazurin n=1 Tax=Roseibium denhamense TaxID=76305 RepID=A0ABY1PL24_9HYPH|nr:pseudoazurin [Roseibium denhamense]MTI05856.1 pseudoazurin [Roseibium denhamense]SMP35495.1 pseudoazurin [Roseibium denhamense]
MPLIIDRRTILASMAAIAATGVAGPAFAEGATHTVQMLNKDPDDRKKRNVFLPLIQVAEPGDTVVFTSVDKGHNSEIIKGMIPDGAEAWKGRISKDLSVTLTQPGVYGYRCTPHAALGMVGLIIVKGDGMMDNVEEAKAVKHRGKAKAVFEEIWAQVDSGNLLA